MSEEEWLRKKAEEATAEARLAALEVQCALMRPFLEAELKEHQGIFARAAKQMLVPIDAEWRNNQVLKLQAALSTDTGAALAAVLAEKDAEIARLNSIISQRAREE